MATPLINGISYHWAVIRFVLFGQIVVGITKISFKSKQDKKNNYGMGNKPVSRAYGNYEYEASIEIYQEEWQRVIAAAPMRDPLAIAPFDIQVLYGSNSIAPENKAILKACEFMENPFEASQGDTKLMATIPLILADIER